MDWKLDDTHYDAILLGTGSVNAILAAAIAKAGKKVLHLDDNEYYGTTWATLNLKEFHNWAVQQWQPDASARRRSCFTGATVYARHSESQGSSLSEVMSKFRSYSIDLSARLIFARGAATDLLIRSDVGKYMEFRQVDSTYVLHSEAVGPRKVPISKSDVFQSSELSMLDKRQLMKFVQLMSSYDDDAKEAYNAAALEKLSEEAQELHAFFDRPFVEYLNSRKLSPMIRSFLLYCIALAEFNQEASARRLSTRDAVGRVTQFIKSIGRYGNGAFLFPLYGCGELPQAFSRLCAVHGGVYLLRSHFSSIVVEAQSNLTKGVITSGNQFLATAYVIAEPQYLPSELPEVFSEDAITSVISRAVCIIDKPLVAKDASPLTSPCMLILPPDHCPTGNHVPVRVLMLDSSFHVVPAGKFLLHIQAVSSDPSHSPEQDLKSAVDYLCNTEQLQHCTEPFASVSSAARPTTSEAASGAASSPADHEQPTGSVKPTALYVVYFQQRVRSIRNPAAISVPSPVPTSPAVQESDQGQEDHDEPSDGANKKKDNKLPAAELPPNCMLLPLPMPTDTVDADDGKSAPPVFVARRPDNLFVTSDPTFLMDFESEIKEAEAVFKSLYPDLPFLPSEKDKKKKTKNHFDDDPDGIGSLELDDDEVMPGALSDLPADTAGTAEATAIGAALDAALAGAFPSASPDPITTMGGAGGLDPPSPDGGDLGDVDSASNGTDQES